MCELAVSKGHRVAYLWPNDIAPLETLFATTHIGAIFVALNTRLAAPELAYLLDDSDPTVLVLAPETESNGLAALGQASARPRVLRLREDLETAIALLELTTKFVGA